MYIKNIRTKDIDPIKQQNDDCIDDHWLGALSERQEQKTMQ